MQHLNKDTHGTLPAFLTELINIVQVRLYELSFAQPGKFRKIPIDETCFHAIFQTFISNK